MDRSRSFFTTLSDDEKEVRTLTARFVREHVRPVAIEDDENCRFRRETFDKLSRLGLHCLAQPAAYGGGGKPHRCHYGFLEELGRGSLSMSVAVGVTNLTQGAIAAFGNEEQKDHFLRKLTSGEWLGAFSLSESQSGSDAAALRLSAKKAPGGYKLSGNKMWCSNAGVADLYLVMARTSEPKTKGITSFLVTKDSPGFRVGKIEKKLGLHADSLAELVFEDCFVPDAQRLGAEGEGLAVALSQLDSGRIAIGSAGLATAVECLERAWLYLKDRPAEFGDGIQQLFGEHYASILAVRHLILEAAARKDRGERITDVASAVKLLASDLAVRVAGDVIVAMGMAGALRENEVERFLRDAKALQIVEGTNQIQRLVLARELERKFQ